MHEDAEPLELDDDFQWEASSCRIPAPICQPLSAISPGKHPEHMLCSAYVCVNSATAPVVRTVCPNFIDAAAPVVRTACPDSSLHIDQDFVVEDPSAAEVVGDAATRLAQDGLPLIAPVDPASPFSPSTVA